MCDIGYTGQPFANEVKILLIDVDATIEIAKEVNYILLRLFLKDGLQNVFLHGQKSVGVCGKIQKES